MDSKVRRMVFGSMRPLYLSVVDSSKLSNDYDTYQKSIDFINEFEKQLEKSNDDIHFVEDYIDFNVSYKESKERYKTICNDVKHELSKLKSYVSKSNTQFTLRKNSQPFLDKGVLELMVKTTNRLVELRVRTNIIRTNVVSRGIDYLIEGTIV